MKYLIHACTKRLKYVENYLIPSMVNQGIDGDNISVYIDKYEEGCLESCMHAFMSVDKEGDTWHLQDDVIICSDFKERTEEDYEEDIVCGYCYEKDGKKDYVGIVSLDQMWYSFPCIRISNKIARSCAKWYFNYAKFANEFHIWVKLKKYDDSIFDVYLERNWPDVRVLNLKPNIVDHIDYLIGGSLANVIREERETHAAYFEDNYLVEELMRTLNENLNRY